MSAPFTRWLVTDFGETPTPKEFIKETEHFLIYQFAHGKTGRDKKSTSWYTYFDTEADALEAIRERKERRAESLRKESARTAAQDLLDALIEAERLYSSRGLVANHSDCGPWINAARAAIAKAEQP